MNVNRFVWQLVKSLRIFLRFKDIKMALCSDIACKLPKNMFIRHSGIGVCISRDVKLGNGITIYQNVTIGGKGHGHFDEGYPIIEDRVVIYGDTYILGDVVVGHDSVIGCKSLVLEDVPPFSVAYGNPLIIKPKLFEFDPNFERYVEKK